MNKRIQHLLALNVIELSKGTHNEHVVHNIEKGKITEEEAVSHIQMIKDIIDSGVSIITPVEYKDKVSILMNHVFFNDNSKNIVEFFTSKLTKEDVSNLTSDMVRDIYESSDNNIKLLDKFFQLGFYFKQGEFNEIDKAISGDIEFFELCMQVKTDFKFSYKYEDDLSLDQILSEDIEYVKNSNYQDNKLQKRESLLSFLKKAREVEELKDNLENQLPNSQQSNFPNKKI